MVLSGYRAGHKRSGTFSTEPFRESGHLAVCPVKVLELLRYGLDQVLEKLAGCRLDLELVRLVQCKPVHIEQRERECGEVFADTVSVLLHAESRVQISVAFFI